MENEYSILVMDSVANLVVAGAMILQTVIFYITFSLGFKELEKHKQKLKIENSFSIADKIIQNLYLINYALEPIFENSIKFSKSNFKENTPYLELPLEFENLAARLFFIEESIEECSPKLEKLIAEIEVSGDFLKDTKTKEIINQYKSSLTDFLSEISLNYLKVTMVEKKDVDFLSSNERVEFVSRKLNEEWKHFVPFSLYDKQFNGVVNFHSKFDSLRNHLIESFVP